MKLFGDLDELKKQREREMELLHTRMATIADAIESEPAQWVGAHPYVALAGAAAVGFIAAQLPRASRPAAAAAPMKQPEPARAAAAAPAPDSTCRFNRTEILELLINLATQFLQREPAETAAAPESTLTIANAGAICGAAFPREFGATAACVRR